MDKSSSTQHEESMSTAILIPCYNEEITIGKVVDDFRRELSDATIYVYDNNSTDRTVQIATEHGATVRHVGYQGKGNVVRAMFREVDADYLIMVDGDDTYPAEQVHDLLRPLEEDRCDMVVGDRLSNGSYAEENTRQFHGFGNDLVRWLVNHLYGVRVNDVMTGYRGFNRTFAKTYPVIAEGFEIETEMTIHCVDKHWRLLEAPIDYRDRPEGSYSKLNTFSDGIKVLKTIGSLFKDYKPLAFFSIVGLVLLVVGLIFGITVIADYATTGLVARFPTAILAVGLVLCGLLSVSCGFILDTVVKGSRKQYELDVQRWIELESGKPRP